MTLSTAWRIGALLLLASPAVPAADWTLRVEGNWADAHGHDQHALTVRDRDTGAAPATELITGVNVSLPRALNYGFSLKRLDGGMGWGFDVFWYGVTADGIRRSAAGSATREIVFEASDQRYASTDAGTVLYYSLREDNRLEAWTADLYCQRPLGPGVELQAGVRFGDFDNDYLSVLGVEGVEGTFLDTSSNYPRMMGPLVGISGGFRSGRNRIEAYVGQSLIAGRASLRYESRHFTGTPSAPAVDDRRFSHDFVSAAIPITELRLRYAYELTDRLSLGTGASTSAWWDVPVPPGVVPGADAATRRHENTVVFYSVLANAEWRF